MLGGQKTRPGLDWSPGKGLLPCPAPSTRLGKGAGRGEAGGHLAALRVGAPDAGGPLSGAHH